MNRTDLQTREARAKRPARPRERLPQHCRPGARRTPAVASMKRRLRSLRLHTVCEEARCPNIGSCFAQGTATFMLLGPVCTRTCRFCNVATGRPALVDRAEPGRVAEAVRRLGLAHAVLTSVNRDDLPDGGAAQFAATIRAVRAVSPRTTLEVLTPDFQGDAAALACVLEARPDLFNHNLETVPRLYRAVRPAARYERSLELLARARREQPALLTKSGLMLGLGETRDELRCVLRDLRTCDVDCVTLGQYLRPTLRHLEVARYLDPAEFDALAVEARALGFRHVASGPLVRSSFHAGDALALLRDTALLRVTAAQESGHVAL